MCSPKIKACLSACLWLKAAEFNILKNRTGGDEFVGDCFQRWMNLRLVLWWACGAAGQSVFNWVKIICAFVLMTEHVTQCVSAKMRENKTYLSPKFSGIFSKRQLGGLLLLCEVAWHEGNRPPAANSYRSRRSTADVEALSTRQRDASNHAAC